MDIGNSLNSILVHVNADDLLKFYAAVLLSKESQSSVQVILCLSSSTGLKDSKVKSILTQV